MSSVPINADLIDWQLLGYPARQSFRPPLIEAVQPVLVVNPASIVQAASYVEYAVSFQSIAALAAATPQTVFAPAANPNGAILWAAKFCVGFATYSEVAFVAKDGAAPATAVDGDVMCSGDIITLPGPVVAGRLEAPLLIPPGKGLYFIATLALANLFSRNCKYTLL